MREGFVPTVLKIFGGLCTFIDRVALRLGLSPDCRNVRFAPNMISTRDGYMPYLADTADPFYGVSQLVRANGDRHLLVVDDLGRLKTEFPGGTLTILESGIYPTPYMKTAELFSTQYMCFSNGRAGKTPMRRYDGQTLAPVGIGAPGTPPVVKENAAASAGTGLLAGVHYAVVVFVNKWGDWSGISPILTTAAFAGGKQLEFSAPLGPPDTVQRIVGISPVGDPGHFLYTDKLIIGDNTTTTATVVDINEDELVNSQDSLNRYASGYVPWMPLGCAAYQERLVLWGARATLQPVFETNVSSTPIILRSHGFWNAAFDGGFASGIPNGWTAVGAGQAAGGSGTVLDGRCLRITGDAVTANRGEISQEVTNSANYVNAGKRYGLSILARHSDLAQGSLKVELAGGPAGGPWTVLLTATIALPIYFQTWYETLVEMGALVGAQYPSLRMRVWAAGGPMGAGEWIDCSIALYDANDVQYHHTLVVSETGRPGTFIGETAIVSIGPDDGEGIRNVFRIRDSLFVAKERSLYALGNTASGDPVTWTADLTDAYGGTPSLHGVANGNGFVVIAGRDGMRYFDGGIPRLISRTIEPTWRSADWLRGERVVVVLDPSKEIIRVALPATTDTAGCSLMYVADFKDGWGDATYEGNGIKWSQDTFDPVTRVLAGTLALSGAGVHIPVFSVFGGLINNRVLDHRDFSGAVFSFLDGAPTITTGLPDGRSGNYASRWDFAGTGSRRATFPAPDAMNGELYTTVSFRAKPDANMVITVSIAGSGPPFVKTCPAGVWTRVYAIFTTNATTLPPGATTTIKLDPGAFAPDVNLADLQVAHFNERADWGFSTLDGGVTYNIAGLLVYPFPGTRRDFSGRIRTRYETGMFGAEVGRGTFDRCLVRALGEGNLNASYVGLSSRTWGMTPVALAALPEEDLEFGADQKASACTLVLENTTEDGWMTVRSLSVDEKAAEAGWARGRNG